MAEQGNYNVEECTASTRRIGASVEVLRDASKSLMDAVQGGADSNSAPAMKILVEQFSDVINKAIKDPELVHQQASDFDKLMTKYDEVNQ